MNKNKKLIEDNIASLSKSLETLVPGTEEHSKAAESLAKLYKTLSEEEVKLDEIKHKTIIEEKKCLQEQERLDLEEHRLEFDKNAKKSEEKFKREQSKKDFKHNLIRIGAEFGIGIATFIAGCYFTSKGFKYEETGVYKSDGQRKLMGNWNIFRRK